MGIGDKFENKTDELTGQAKETAGDASGNHDLKNEGKGEQVEANLKQAGEKAKDIFK